MKTKDAHALRQRLHQYRATLRAQGVRSIPAFAAFIGIPRKTVEGWLHPHCPHAPHLANVLELARQTGLSLDWLLLGEGPPLRRVSRPAQALQTDVREYLGTHLAQGPYSRYRREILNDLPPAEEILRDLVEGYRHWFQQRVHERAQWMEAEDRRFYKKLNAIAEAQGTSAEGKEILSHFRRRLLDPPRDPSQPAFFDGWIADDADLTQLAQEQQRIAAAVLEECAALEAQQRTQPSAGRPEASLPRSRRKRRGNRRA